MPVALIPFTILATILAVFGVRLKLSDPDRGRGERQP
jgi:hypothetical protein